MNTPTFTVSLRPVWMTSALETNADALPVTDIHQAISTAVDLHGLCVPAGIDWMAFKELVTILLLNRLEVEQMTFAVDHPESADIDLTMSVGFWLATTLCGRYGRGVLRYALSGAVFLAQRTGVAA